MRRYQTLLMVLWLTAHPLTAGAAALSNGPSLDELAHRYSTPNAIARFLRQEFTVTRDAELFGEADYWQRPEEFAARRAGDCEDFAMLARELLLRNWIKAYTLSVYGKDGYAHTVCVFIDPHGWYNVIDEGAVRYAHATSLEALASQLHPGWTAAGITEPDGTRGRFIRQLIP